MSMSKEEAIKEKGEEERRKKGMENWLNHIEIHKEEPEEVKRGIEALRNLLGVE